MKFNYSKGYLHLPIKLNNEKLPKTIVIQNTNLHIKTSFHVSLMCIKNIEKNCKVENIAEKIINLFCEFTKDNEVVFGDFTGEFRFAERDEDGRKSLVGMCNIKNLNNFFDKVNSDFGLNISYQPTHVSFYTLNLDEAIGLNNQQDIETMTKDISNHLSKELINEILKN